MLPSLYVMPEIREFQREGAPHQSGTASMIQKAFQPFLYIRSQKPEGTQGWFCRHHDRTRARVAKPAANTTPGSQLSQPLSYTRRLNFLICKMRLLNLSSRSSGPNDDVTV